MNKLLDPRSELELVDLFEQLTDLVQSNNQPAIRHLLEEHPVYASELGRLIPSLQLLANLDASAASTGDRGSGIPFADFAPENTLGDFRILRQIGRGGMGVVYEAEQLSMPRRVALKVLPMASLVDSRALQRFKNEVAAVATLEHPHIVPVYAVGEDRGIHYYAMKLIRGQSLAAVIRELRARTDREERLSGDAFQQAVASIERTPFHSPLSSGESRLHEAGGEGSDAPEQSSVPLPPLRGKGQSEGDAGEKSADLDVTSAETVARGRSSTIRHVGDPTYFRNVAHLIQQAAEALQHAHDHGIVHRDVKPGNLLLDAQGTLFVADFGLARIETGPGVTMTGDVLGTLRYMSPEQVLANRVVIDHRTDIYSLGVTLYELLTLQPMWTGDAKAEVIRQISFEEPTRPQRINPAIPTDLETIVLKTISKIPSDRYASAQAFANDLQHFLDYKSIMARRPTTVQRIAKWTRRNPAIMWSAIAVLSVAIIGLSIGSLMIARERTITATALGHVRQEKARAQQREQEAIEAVRLFGDSVANNFDLKHLPELESLRITLLQEPLAFFKTLRERLSAEADRSNESMAQLANVVFELGKLNREIGNTQSALTCTQNAMAIYESLARKNPNEAIYQSDLARTHNVIAYLLGEMGKPDEAQLAHQRALEIRQWLVKSNPNDAVFRRELALSHNEFGSLLCKMGKTEVALTAQQRALEIRQALVHENPSVSQYQQNLADSHFDIGYLLREMGKPNEALVAYQQALEIRRRLTQDHPTVALYQRDLAGSYSAFAQLLRETGKPDEALAAYQHAIGTQERLARANPSTILYKDWLSVTLHNMGILLCDMGKFDDALVAYQQAREIAEKLVLANPTVIRHKIKLADDYTCIGNLLSRSGKTEQALIACQQALDILVQLAPENYSLIDVKSSLATSYNSIGILLVQNGKPDQALDALVQSLEIRKELASDNPERPQFQSSVAATLSNISAVNGEAGKVIEAADQLVSAIEYQNRALAVAPNHPVYREFLYNHYFNLLYLNKLDSTALSPEASRVLQDWSRSKGGNLNEQYAIALNEIVWESVKTPDSPNQVKITACDLAEMRLVVEQFPQGMFANTLGTVEYRMGNYEAAIIACSNAVKLSANGRDHPGPDPGDLAVLAMSHQKLGHIDEANKYRAQFAEAMSDGQFNDADYQNFAREVETVFTEKP